MDNNINGIITDFYKENILLVYRGVFENSLLAVIAKNIRDKTNNESTGKTVFRIFVELSQNISFYSNEREVSEHGLSGSGIIVLKKQGAFLHFAAGNVATKPAIEKILEKCEFINQMSHEELREYKRSQYKLKQDGKPDAHIGLIQTAILSGNKIELNITEISPEEAFITIATRIEQ